MITYQELWMHAPAGAIFRLAAEVERWPELLPHYRWVALLERAGNRKLVDMAASRDGIPVRWRAVQRLEPDIPRITFRHVKGVTRGMEVEWSFHEHAGGTVVCIRHELTLHWPVVGRWAADHIIGRAFIEHIASRTLQHIKRLAEAAA